MNKKIIVILCVFVCILCSFKSDSKSEAFGKQFFSLLKASPEVSKEKIKACFIPAKALKEFPKTEITTFSKEEFHTFIKESIVELQEEAKGYRIVWEDIKYVKTETSTTTDSGIDLQVLHLYFEHDVYTFKLQLVTLLHKNEIKLIRIMYLDYVSG